ncbi:MAG: signal peptide peptidase SppA [Lachnospiraceae bacterium]|nr:signal peptide peptidase SppA [Lachnospiraceae bacterium]
MKRKQLIGLIVAASLFVVICIISMITRYFLGNETYENKGLFGAMEELDKPTGNYIGIITIDGEIAAGSGSSFVSTAGYNHERILNNIETYESEKSNKGIMVYINSPGGSVNASDEVYLRLMEYKEKTERPVWVYMADECCSGGYYIAMAGDRLIANRNTWTGSIGVYVALNNYKELMDKLGVKTTYIKTGANKAMGAATEELTEEQHDILQGVVDEAYDQFISVIVDNRTELTEEKIRELADGRIYTAKQALEFGLIDDITKTYKEAEDLMIKEVGEDLEMYEIPAETSFWDEFYAGLYGMKSKSDTEMLLDMMENDNSGEAMYYAMPGQN